MRRILLAILTACLLSLATVGVAVAGPTENTGQVTIPDAAKKVGMPASSDGRKTADDAIPGP